MEVVRDAMKLAADLPGVTCGINACACFPKCACGEARDALLNQGASIALLTEDLQQSKACADALLAEVARVSQERDDARRSAHVWRRRADELATLLHDVEEQRDATARERTTFLRLLRETRGVDPVGPPAATGGSVPLPASWDEGAILRF